MPRYWRWGKGFGSSYFVAFYVLSSVSLNDLDRRQHGKEFVNTRFQVYEFVANMSDSEQRFVVDRVLRVGRCAHSHSRAVGTHLV